MRTVQIFYFFIRANISDIDLRKREMSLQI